MKLQSVELADGVTTRVEVNGIHLGVRERGKMVDASLEQPVIVFIHGFTGAIGSWDALLEAYAQRGSHVIALDMLGHGLSDAPEDPQRYAMEHCRQDVIAVLQKLQIASGRAILVGYSMGARIALYCALGGYFRALALESGSPGLVSPDEREQRRRSDEAIANCIGQYGIEAFVDYWEQLPIFAGHAGLSLEMRASLRDQRLHNSTLGLANSLRGVGTGVQPSLHDRLTEITLPTLLITGADDKKFCDIAREMLAKMPRAQHHSIPGAGHTAHLEQPAAFDVSVQEFCRSVQ
jgi:2-succinyl-6-hydroxy-2,4-cyclohexadiene-1-carboxylate synthase